MTVLSQQHHVYAVDIPGEAGNSADNRLDLSARDYADWLNNVLDALAIDRANVVGNSLGGWMALKFAVTYPERVSKLALIATSGLSKQNPATMDASEAEQAELADEIGNGVKLPDEVQAFIDMILDGYLPLREELPVFTDDQLNTLTMPVLFVAGENDVMTDVKASALRLKTNLPQAQIRILSNTGHIVLNALNELLPFLTNAPN
jgi:pimeloyl-ACP methyl ester carboxylesterase